MKQKFKKLSIQCFVLALVLFALSFVLFHFLTDSGFTTVWQPEAGKPFVTDMIGQLGVLLLFAAIMCRLAGKILFAEKEN